MRLYLTPDPDLRAFAVAPAALKAWLRLPRTLPDVSLQEYWRDLDAVLAATPLGRARPLLTANGADWIFPDIADRGAYAISSVSTQRLLSAVEEVDRPIVEAYVRERWALRARRTGIATEITPAQLASATEKVLLYLGRLREACTLCGAKGYGILMALWEDA